MCGIVVFRLSQVTMSLFMRQMVVVSACQLYRRFNNKRPTHFVTSFPVVLGKGHGVLKRQRKAKQPIQQSLFIPI